MRARLSTALAVALLVLSMVVVASAGGAAAADPDGTVLPFQYFESMVTDQVHDLAYISGSDQAGRTTIAEVDATGAVMRTFAGPRYASGMTLSDDSATLYVAVGTSGLETITAIDVATDERHTWGLGEPRDVDNGSCDMDLAVVDGLIWFNLCRDARSNRGLGVLDPASGAVHYSDVLNNVDAALASDPQLPHRLVVESEGIYTLAIDDDSETPVVSVVAERAATGLGGSLSMVPGGGQVLVGGSVLRTSDLASVDSYPAEDASTSAESADGTVAVGGGAAYDDTQSDLFVYRPGHTVFAQQTDYGLQVADKSSVFLALGGLGFGTDSLFAVTWSGRDQRGDPPIIHVSRPDPPADPSGTKDLALPFVNQLIADPSHAQEFVSTGGDGNGLVVLDDGGRVVRVVQHLPGISQMTLSGSTLWMSLESGDALAAMDTRTYAVKKYFLGADARPQTVAVAAGEVWFANGYGSDNDAFGSDSLGALDPATGEVYAHVARLAAFGLRASAIHPHSMYADADALPPPFSQFTNNPEVRINVTGSPRPTATVKAAREVGGGFVDAVETPDRLSLAMASETTPLRAIDASSLAPLGRVSDYWYDGGRALAARSDGLVARGYEGYMTPDVVMRFGALGPTWRKVDLPPGTGLGPLVPDGLAFGSTNLYALIQAGSALDRGRHYRVTTIPAPARQKLSLTSAGDYYLRGDPVHVVAHVEPRLLPQHPLISIQAVPHGGSVQRVTSDARPDAWGNVTVSATFRTPVTYSAQVHFGAASASAHLCLNLAYLDMPCR